MSNRFSFYALALLVASSSAAVTAQDLNLNSLMQMNCAQLSGLESSYRDESDRQTQQVQGQASANEIVNSYVGPILGAFAAGNAQNQLAVQQSVANSNAQTQTTMRENQAKAANAANAASLVAQVKQLKSCS